jgi:hypothetical protein
MCLILYLILCISASCRRIVVGAFSQLLSFPFVFKSVKFRFSSGGFMPSSFHRELRPRLLQHFHN